MTDTYATVARPPGCAVAWATKHEIFVELPCAGAPPYVVRYPRSTVGLANALNILVENPTTERPRLDHPVVRRVGTQPFTEDQRTRARAVLKRLKIT